MMLPDALADLPMARSILGRAFNLERISRGPKPFAQSSRHVRINLPNVKVLHTSFRSAMAKDARNGQRKRHYCHVFDLGPSFEAQVRASKAKGHFGLTCEAFKRCQDARRADHPKCCLAVPLRQRRVTNRPMEIQKVTCLLTLGMPVKNFKKICLRTTK